MQGGSPWGDVPDENQPKSEDAGTLGPQPISISDGFAPMNQDTLLTGTTQMPTGQLIYLQPPSSAAKVVGILSVIYGFIFGISFNILSLFASSELGSTTFIALDVVNIIAGGGMLIGGVMMINYQRRGIILLFCAIALTTLVGVAQISMVDTAYDQMLEDGDMSQEEYDAVQSVDDSVITGIGIVILAFCNALCGLIVAIPLMVSNNGLDDSKLFG
ncbi:MAG: hypothetical protein QF880_06830 [Candidatus Poseidonia sp.]|nr:hypothetical protein [Poseidonia sp.]